MDAHFTRSFYKHVLGNPVEYTDIQVTSHSLISTPIIHTHTVIPMFLTHTLINIYTHAHTLINIFH